MNETEKKNQIDHLALFFSGVAFGLRHPEAKVLEPKHRPDPFEAFNQGLRVGEAILEDVVTGKKLGLTVADIVELELEKIKLNHFI